MARPKLNAVFISGASSGLGYELALRYADRTSWIGISARRKENLQRLQSECEAKGAQVLVYPLDITNLNEVRQAAHDFKKKVGQVDIVLANAGVGSGVTGDYRPTEKLTEIINVNVNGVIHLINEFLPLVEDQPKAVLAATGSIAGFRAIPGSVYSASKSAVKFIMDSYRLENQNKAISFCTLCPGFVETPMTSKNKFSMPFIIKADKAALIMERALDRRKKTTIFPAVWKLVVPFLRVLPDWVLRAAHRRTIAGKSK